MKEIGVYIHIPFCFRKCAYCDFNSYAGLEGIFGDYVRALAREIEAAPPGLSAGSIYLGGGTPTILSIPLLEEILAACRARFAFHEEMEITVEANPGTVNKESLKALLLLGVNRLSFGVQSFKGRWLRLLGRIHSAEEARQSFRLAREGGFGRINLDLIYGLPGQKLQDFREDLRQALELAPDHLSLYGLSLKESTPLARRIARGELPPLDSDRAAEMYELAEEMLAESGYLHYEISNWAQPGAMCRHNLRYWRNEPYLGFGAGAHSYFAGKRYANLSRPEDYIARPGEREMEEEISQALEMAETMILGLRLVEEGVSFERFFRRFGRPLNEVYGPSLEELVELGLIEINGKRVRLTRRGRLLGNEVFERFL